MRGRRIPRGWIVGWMTSRDQFHNLLQQIVFDLASGRKILQFFLHYLTGVLFLRKVAVLPRRPWLNWIEHLTTERYRYDRPMTRATPFATDVCHAVFKAFRRNHCLGLVYISAQNVMNQERPDLGGGDENQTGVINWTDALLHTLQPCALTRT